MSAVPSVSVDLGLLVIAKNESMVIDEFICHYRWQGVQHFYVIDNGSNDGMAAKLLPHVRAGYLSYFCLPERYQQNQHYNKVFRERAQRECKWLLVVDVDEYVYDRREGSDIRSYLSSLDSSKVGRVAMVWKMFGSSGHATQPPSGIRANFLWRSVPLELELGVNSKCILKCALCNQIDMHNTVTTGDTIMAPPELALNHYAIMSREYFGKVKMTRGDVAAGKYETVRDWSYFDRYDHKEVFDDELANLLRANEGLCDVRQRQL